jgi:hypothetical protein
MIRSVPFALAFLALAAVHSEPSRLGDCDPHVRSDEPSLLAALREGSRVSPTLHRLVEQLEGSNVVVYLMYDRSPAPTLAGHTSLLTTAAGRRYLRVSIDRRNVGCRLVGMLGHELQHAVEIAESPSATDNAGVASLYQRIGFRSGGMRGDCFDTAAAILAGRMIEREVLGRYKEFTRTSASHR